MTTLLAALGAYCLGSISFAVVVSRLMRLPDPRSYGSKNPGATNVLRTGRWAAAVLTLAGDAGKGWLAVWLASVLAWLMLPKGCELMLSTDCYLNDVRVASAAALAAFLGHLFPVFHRFQGGKGVATAAGVLLGLNPWLGLETIATWLIVATFFRYSSVASLIAAVFAPLYAWWLFGFDERVLAVLCMAALLVLRHRGNIARLIGGTEPRLGEKKPTPTDPSAA